MHHSLLFKTSACAVALFSGSAAIADVTAAEVWDSWKDAMGVYGESAITIGSEQMTSDSVTVTGLALNYSDDETTLTGDLGTLIFQEQGDGTVLITAPAQMPMIAVDADGTSMTMSVVQSGMTLVASGDPDAITYDVTADRYGFEVTEIDGAEGPVEGDIRFTANDLTGQISMITAAMRDISYDIAAASLDLLVDVEDPEGEDGTILMSGKMNNLAAVFDMSMPLDMTVEDAETAFQRGFKLNSNYGYEAASYLFEVDADGTKANGTLATGATQVTGVFNNETVAYNGDASGLNFDLTSSDMPFPVNVSMSEYGFGFKMPLATTDEPADFALNLNLTNLALNDEIWMLGDPAGTLPHDPATLNVDLSGKAKLLFDLLDPNQAEALALAAMPGELYALTLNDLTVDAVGAVIKGSGAFTFDNSDLATFNGLPRPLGDVTINIKGANALIDNLIAMGLLPEDQAMMGRMMMGMFARTVGDDELTSTIEVNAEGHLLANGQRLQ